MKKLLIFLTLLGLAAGLGAQQVQHQFAATDLSNIFTASNQFTVGTVLGPALFSQLGTPVDGTLLYCKDCKVVNPCLAGGNGAFAQRVNGTWQCGGSGTGGTPGGTTTEVQFNSSGVFSGTPDFTWVDPALTLGQPGLTTGQLSLASVGGGNTVLQSASPGGGTATLPANTGTLAELNLAQAWTTAQTFQNFLLSNGTQTATLSLATLGANRVYTLPDSGGNNSIALTAGVLTNGDCAKFDASGNLVDFGGSCGGTQSPGTPFNAIQFNRAGSFGGSASLTWVSPTLTIGNPGSTGGQLGLAGATSGTALIAVPTAAGGTWTLRNFSDNFVGAATPDTFTNKTYDTAGFGNVFKVAGISITGAQGNGSLVQLSTGTPTAGDCVKFDVNLNTADAGQPCATANAAGAATQVQYNSNGTALGASAALTFSAPTLTVGQAGTSTGILALAGLTSGTTSLTTAATASGTWTLRAATDNVVGAATTDTLTNKTFDTAGTGNVFKVNGTQITAVTGTGAVVLATSPTIGTSLTIGGTSNQLIFSGNTNATTISVGNPAAARTYTLPDSGGNNKLALTAGALVNGDCAKFDANGNLVDVGSPCGSTTPGGLTTQVQFNSTGSFAGSANLTWVSPTLTIGAGGSATGILALGGATSGSVSVTTAAAAGGTATFANQTGTVVEAASSLTTPQVTFANGPASVTGSANLTFSSPALTIGVAGATTGQLKLANATSGTITLTPASGGGTLTLPAATLTLVGSAAALTVNSIPLANAPQGLANSSLSDNGTLVSGTEGVSLALTSTTSVGLKVTLPALSTSDTAEFFGINGTGASVNYAGELVLDAGTATQYGASYLMQAGVESTPATTGEVIFNGTTQELYDGVTWQKFALWGIQNTFSQENFFNQPAAATTAMLLTAAASPTANLVNVNNNSGTTQSALGCQTSDSNCPAAFGFYAPAIATVGGTSVAGASDFAAGTTPGLQTLGGKIYASLGGPASLASSYLWHLPGTVPVAGQQWQVGTCSSGDCTGSFVYPGTLTVANAGTTGTVLNTLTKLTGAPSTAVETSISDTAGVVGVTTAGAGTTGNATIQIWGSASCVFDGGTTANDYVITSTTTAGNCHDGGASYPTSGQVIGRVLSTNAAGGTYALDLFPAEIRGGSGGGGGSGTVNNSSVVGALGYYAATGTAISPNTGDVLSSGGAFTSYNGLTVVGQGVEPILYNTASTGNVAALGSTTMYTVGAVGASGEDFVFSAVLEQSGAGTCTTYPILQLQVAYTDNATSNALSYAVSLVKNAGTVAGSFTESSSTSAASVTNGSFKLRAKASTTINYLVNVTNTPSCTTFPPFDIYPMLKAID